MTIRSTMSKIEREASWAQHHAKQAAEYVRQLTDRRSFETSAEAELATAELELVTAIAVIRNARKQYASKSVNDKAA